MSKEKLQLTAVERRVARNLKRLRGKTFSVRGLAEELANQNEGGSTLTYSAISQVENCRRRLSIDEMWTISRVLDVSPIEFLLPTSSDDGGGILPPDDHSGSIYVPPLLANRIIRHIYKPLTSSTPEFVRKEVNRWLEKTAKGTDEERTQSALQELRYANLTEIAEGVKRIEKLLGDDDATA